MNHRFYLFAMLDGQTVRQAVQPAHDAIAALYQSGFLPPTLMPDYNEARDKAIFTSSDSRIILIAQRA